MSVWDEQWRWWDRLLDSPASFEPVPSALTVAYRPAVERSPDFEWLESLTRQRPLRRGTLEDWRFVAIELEPGTDKQALLGRLVQTASGRALPVVRGRGGEMRFFVPGRVSIQLAAGAAADGLDELARELGGEVVYRSRVAEGFGHIALAAGAWEPEVIAKLYQDPAIRVASFAEFGLGETVVKAGKKEKCKSWGVRKIKADEVKVTNTNEVVVALLDSGADLTHPYLASRILPQPKGEDRNFLEADESPHETVNGHGTHVAGIVAAVAPACLLLPLRVGLVHDVQDTAYKDALMLLVNKLSGKDSQKIERLVVNISHELGTTEPPQLKDAIIQAVKTTPAPLLIAGAGNGSTKLDNQTKRFPASFPEVMAIAATDESDVKVCLSNYGAVAAAAPGESILSSWPGGGTACKTGTSMAAPHAAGVAALIWRQHGSLTAAEVRDRLLAGCEDIDTKQDPEHKGGLGKGRINAKNSI